MNATKLIAKQLRDLYFGGNWTAVSYQQQIDSVTLEQALTKIKDLNTIAVLVFHTNYYVEAITRVLKGQPINAKDALSFNHPEFKSEKEWDDFKSYTLKNVEELLPLIENLDDKKLSETFVDDKYGSYYRNLHGLIEHSHYHLGQIVILKKLG